MASVREEKVAVWRQVMTDRSASEMTAAAFGRSRGIAIHQFHFWRKRLAVGSRDVPPGGGFIRIEGDEAAAAGVTLLTGSYRIALAAGFSRRRWFGRLRLWKQTAADEKRFRQRPIVDALFGELRRRLVEDPLVLPQSKIGKAIAYLLKRPEAFCRYLNDPQLRMDNNLAERHMRKVALGRKNWLFVGSHRAGRHMAILLSFAQACHAVGINPAEWFDDILRVLPDWPQDRLAELLPDNWLAARNG